MFGLDPLTLAIVAAAVAAGGVVKGATGIGLPIVTMAILLNVLPPATVLALLVVPIVVTNLWQAVRAGHPLEPARRFWPMIVAVLVFLWIGARLVVALDTSVLFGVLGCCVTVFAATSFFRPRARPLSPRTERWAGPLAGAAGGLLGGLSTIWGPPMTMYFVMLKLPKDTFVRAVGLVWFCASVPLVVAYTDNGLLNADTAPLSAAASVPGLIGIRIGEVIRARIDQEVFRKTMLVVLVIIGLNLIRRAVF